MTSAMEVIDTLGFDNLPTKSSYLANQGFVPQTSRVSDLVLVSASGPTPLASPLLTATNSSFFPIFLHCLSRAPSLACPTPIPGLLYLRRQGRGRVLAQMMLQQHMTPTHGQAGGSERFYDVGPVTKPGCVREAQVRLKVKLSPGGLGAPREHQPQRKVE